MTEAILLFTFSPVQSFIAEARRAADLNTGSQILVELAKAAAESIGKERLIYPALDEHGELPQDIPNKLVAKVPFEECEKIAKNTRKALLSHWNKEYLENGTLKDGIAKAARKAFEAKLRKHTEKIPDFDIGIWNRQTADDYLWEIYWSAALLPDKDHYKEAYAEAEAALNATKFTRVFHQFEEKGFKDTLSGKREALHAENQNGREYWFQVGKVEQITPIKIRPSVGDDIETGRPRERLDAIGVVKRFHPEPSKKGIDPFHGFPSTSSIASLTFLESAKKHGRSELDRHHKAVANLLQHDEKFEIRDDDQWQYDGDLLYPETLRPNRMKSDYGEAYSSESNLNAAMETLNKLFNALQGKREELRKKGDPFYTEIFTRPSPYYAIIKLDGDSMGKCLHSLDEQGHREFSKKLSEFAAKVKVLAADPQYHACIIYNGGDDVLAMASLSKAVEFAKEMAVQFKETMKEWKATASAGIVITHHLSPLNNALREVGEAEKLAKEIDREKSKVYVTVLRRSGEKLQMVSKWEQINNFAVFVKYFETDELAAKLPYDIARASFALSKTDKMSAEELKQMDEMSAAEIRRLVKRHSSSKVKDTDKQQRANALSEWAKTMPRQIEELANWLSLIRFVSQGGKS